MINANRIVRWIPTRWSCFRSCLKTTRSSAYLIGAILLISLTLSACIPGSGQLKLTPQQDNFWTPGPDAGGSSYDCNAVGHGNEDNLVMVGEIFWDNYCRNIIGLKYDLSGIPAGAVIESATMYLYMESAEGQDSTSLVAGIAPEEWGEDTETWGAGLLWCEEEPSTSIPVGLVPGWVSWDVTALVEELVADPASDHGLCLARDNMEQGWRIFTSLDGKTDQRPYLEIEYQEAP